MGVSVINFLSEKLNEGFQRVVFSCSVITPNGLDDCVPGKDMPGVPHQEFQQHVFLLRQRNLLAVASDLVSAGVKTQVVYTQLNLLNDRSSSR